MTLKELRRKRGLTESEMAARMGFSRPGLYKIEKGLPTSTDALHAYAKALGLPFVAVAEAWEESGERVAALARCQ